MSKQIANAAVTLNILKNQQKDVNLATYFLIIKLAL